MLSYDALSAPGDAASAGRLRAEDHPFSRQELRGEMADNGTMSRALTWTGMLLLNPSALSRALS